MKDEFDLSPLQLDALREIGNIGAILQRHFLKL